MAARIPAEPQHRRRCVRPVPQRRRRLLDRLDRQLRDLRAALAGVDAAAAASTAAAAVRLDLAEVERLSAELRALLAADGAGPPPGAAWARGRAPSPVGGPA